VFQNELQRRLTRQLGVGWNPDHNGTRELTGLTPGQLRAFSKRTAQIEAELAGGSAEWASPADRMRAHDQASLDTRPRKDTSLTPEVLRDRWRVEADKAGLGAPTAVDRRVVARTRVPGALSEGEVSARLVDPEGGLCAQDARFKQAHVVAAVAAMSRGRWTVEQIEAFADRFLASDLVVRLVPPTQAAAGEGWWSTVEHRHVEDRLLASVDMLIMDRRPRVAPTAVRAALQAELRPLGADQDAAVELLCGEGGAVRLLVSPAGFGKTATLHAAASAAAAGGHPVIALAATNKAVAELHGVGLEAATIARFALDGCPLPIGAEVIVDEISQVSTRDAAEIFAAVATVPGAQVWCVGDDRQAQSVRAGGLAVHLRHLGEQGVVPMVGLSVNRRQVDPDDQCALTALRSGHVEVSQTIRTEHGWEHETATPDATRQGLAEAAVADMAAHGAGRVAVLAVSHADCEDLADRIRGLLQVDAKLSGPVLEGPGWGVDPRRYQAGDRVLLHATLHSGVRRLHNGTTGTVAAVTPEGLTIQVDGGDEASLPVWFVAGHRQDCTPKLSHAWARTVDGAQGGTWDQVHLLGSPALDRLTGYVGQSRGRQPTHTWNVRPVHDEHAGIVVEPPTAAEHVGRAMNRDPVKTFAAYDDPHVLDRQLRAERADHGEILARRPAFEPRDLAAARTKAKEASTTPAAATTKSAHWQDFRAAAATSAAFALPTSTAPKPASKTPTQPMTLRALPSPGSNVSRPLAPTSTPSKPGAATVSPSLTANSTTTGPARSSPPSGVATRSPTASTGCAAPTTPSAAASPTSTANFRQTGRPSSNAPKPT
jgi:hypothetical protein